MVSSLYTYRENALGGKSTECKDGRPMACRLCVGLKKKLLLCRDGFLGACLLAQGGGLVGLLPAEVALYAAKVAVSGGLLVDGAAQLQALDNALGRELE